jgi:serine/threonine protein kinase
VRLTGFGIASRLPRERQTLERPETTAGTLAYMAPEQTGRMNRSIDSRSDLHALGVTFYQMLTGSPPFAATDPMEWVHCHIARRPMTPSERVETVPTPLSELVMKLLAKTAKERYQTAAGVQRDLQRCLDDWEVHGRIGDFPLGQHDMPDRLLIPSRALSYSFSRSAPCSPPSTASSRAARRSSRWSPAIPASANPRSSTNCTGRLRRRADCSHPARSTSATSPIRLWRTIGSLRKE